MYILKNALLSITRNKGRNVLIAIVIIVIASSCAITLAIQESAKSIVSTYTSNNPIKASISMNRNNLMNFLKEGDKSSEDMIAAFNEITSLSEDEIISYGTSSNVKDYSYTYSLSLNAKDIKEATDSLVKEKTEVKTETNSWAERGPGGMSNMPGGGTSKQTTTTITEKIFNEKASSGAFTLIGYNSYEDMEDFITGKYTITSGEVSADFNSSNCVISEELASLNNLEVGSTITLTTPQNEANTFDIIVTGIYKENSENENNLAQMFSNSANQIITNANFIKNILITNEELEPTITPTFILNDEESTTSFKAEVEAKGLSEYYTITDNLSEIKSATTSIENVKNFAFHFLLITLAIGGVILLIINMINIRERKYEIGVLRTIGLKKTKLIFQFLTETLIVSLIALLIGAGFGSLISVPLANNLLQTEITSAEEEKTNINENFGRPTKESNSQASPKEHFPNFNLTQVNQIDTINAVVDFKILGELLGIGILLTIFGSLASIISISRFSPLTILKERS